MLRALCVVLVVGCASSKTPPPQAPIVDQPAPVAAATTPNPTIAPPCEGPTCAPPCEGINCPPPASAGPVCPKDAQTSSDPSGAKDPRCVSAKPALELK